VAATGGNDPRAVAILRDVLKDPSAEQWLFKYKEGLSALEAGWFDVALEAFNRCLLLAPGNPAALLQIGYAYMRQGKNLKAAKIFSRIDEIPSACYLKGICLSRIGKDSEAFDAMAKAEEGYSKLEGDNAPPKEFWLEYAVIADRLGRRGKEESILVELRKKYPDDADVNNFLGYIWADWNKNLDEAEKLIGKALAKEPDNVAYLDSMGWVVFRKGRLDEAFEYISKALEKDSPLPDAVILDHAGDIAAARGDKEEALRYWRRALEIYNEDLDRDATREKIAAAEGGGDAGEGRR
jgi:tetratricopeptide (TPR) repeat protein